MKTWQEIKKAKLGLSKVNNPTFEFKYNFIKNESFKFYFKISRNEVIEDFQYKTSQVDHYHKYFSFAFDTIINKKITDFSTEGHE